MILQELARYYERKSHDPDTALAPEGFEWKEIPFIIVLDPSGQFRQIEDTRRSDDRGLHARAILVPHSVKRSSTQVAANLLWDTAEYALGIEARGTSVVKRHADFQRRMSELPQDDIGVQSVLTFLKDHPLESLRSQASWAEIQKKNRNVTFQLSTDPYVVCERPRIIQAISCRLEHRAVAEMSSGICLISGQEAIVERIHPVITGVMQFKGGMWRSQSRGNIVAFNKRSFESYGKDEKQGANAPVGKHEAFAYTTAINHLLRRDSRQKVQVGDASVVFWAERSDPFERSFASFFGDDNWDNPDARTPDVKALYRSVEQGSPNVTDNANSFFVLGMVAPNDARISIRFWLTGTVRDFSQRIRDHFSDISIAPYRKRGSKEPLPRYLSLGRLLRSTALRSDRDNIQPNLAGDTMRAILSGLPYPETLLVSALRRARVEHDVSYPRAALIKACLNRSTRLKNPKTEEELHVSLDPANINIGYRLGRLFAALEKVQEEANPGLNATIRDRFYGAASSTPVTVFAVLLKLNIHHLGKIENRGRTVNLERLIQEICDGIDAAHCFPAQLELADQGRFAIGYYHQKQSFYTRKQESAQGDQK
jgi:CRISPR-associated protein Csd1